MGLWISLVKKPSNDRPGGRDRVEEISTRLDTPLPPGAYWNHRISGKIPAKSGQQKT